MNTQLKKGDKCQSPWGKCIVTNTYSEKGTVDVETPTETMRYISTELLTRIPSHADRMQSMLDTAWYAENRLDDNETVQLRVGAFVEFARHYCAISDQLDECIQCFKLNAKTHLIFAEETEKILKGKP